MSATSTLRDNKGQVILKGMDVTHDIGLRISWNNRPAISIRPELSDKKMGLPGAEVSWQSRRERMQNVCLHCHEQQWVENFYVQYDGLIELYHDKFARPGLALYNLAKPLLRPAQFANRLDFIWFEIWHHEGRRARHGASMMGPDYTHWHGTYEIARNFYTEYIEEIEHLIRKGKDSTDAEQVAAAERLEHKLREILESSDHRWYLNKMDPREKERRDQRMKEFKKRYDR
jgi:hypothetical protein